MNKFFAFLLLVFVHPIVAKKIELDENQKAVIKKGFVTVDLQGQFGNQLFQIATAFAYSLDQNIPFIMPDLFSEKKWNIGENATRLFRGRISSQPLPKAQILWKEPGLGYTPIPSKKNIRLNGFFQSEKYFQHRRAEILHLFAPPEHLKQKILAKFPILNSPALVVGVQIRDYRHEFPTGASHPTHGRSYYQKAVSYFPPGTVFVISTNSNAFAKNCMEGLAENLIYLDSGDYIEDFFTLSLCKSFIISNSSFGWLAAWLSEWSEKTIIAPRPWLASPYDDDEATKDRFPSDWIIINN